MRKLTFGIIVLFFYATHLRAQDIHFSQFFLSPLTLNPANTGNFEGTVRLGGIYRDQWWSVVGSTPFGFNGQFKTYSVSIDAPIIKGFREQDWLGVGLMIFQDESGPLGLKYTASQLSAAYHFALDKDRTRVFTIGVQGGAIGRDFDQELLQATDNIFLSEIQGGGQSPDRALIQTSGPGGDPNGARGGRTDYSAGLLYQGVVGEESFMTIGLAVNHITRPRKPLVSGVTYRIPMRVQAHASANFSLTPRLFLSPTVLYQNVSSVGSELNIAAIGGLLVNDKKGIVVNAGIGYRVLDALEIYTGLDYGDFRIGIAFDWNTTALMPTNALELGATYIARIYKKPKVDNILFCPRF